MDEAHVSSMIENSNKELISQFKILISDSISDLKRSNEATASHQMREIKRIKRDHVPQFNKKSNKDQFKANKAVTEAVEDAQAALRTRDLEETKEGLDRGMALLQESQKLILLPDKSPYGWKTVLEYKHHDLADDEQDEKKIHRAESRAARAVKRSASRTSQHQRKFLPALLAKSPQLAASQLPNLFSRVNQRHSAQRSTSGVCLFVLRVANPDIKGFVVLLCSNLAGLSLLSDSLTSFQTTFAIQNFRISHPRI